MENLRIVGWSDYDSLYPTKTIAQEDMPDVIGLIRKEIIDNNYYFSGEEHQCSLTGVPVFSDGTCFRASMRAWASLMAGIYTKENGEPYNYMDFYMTLSDSRLPEYKNLDVAPAKDVEFTFPIIIAADNELLSQTLSLGMTFMTTDKALNEIYDAVVKYQESEEDE